MKIVKPPKSVVGRGKVEAAKPGNSDAITTAMTTLSINSNADMLTIKTNNAEMLAIHKDITPLVVKGNGDSDDDEIGGDSDDDIGDDIDDDIDDEFSQQTSLSSRVGIGRRRQRARRRMLNSPFFTNAKIVKRLRVPLRRKTSFSTALRSTVSTLTLDPDDEFIARCLYAQEDDTTGEFNLMFDNGVAMVQITNGTLGTGTLAQVLSTGNTSGGTDIVVTSNGNISLASAATNATEGFLRATHMPGVPIGDTGTSGGELAYDTVGDNLYVHTGGGVWVQPTGTVVWETDALPTPMIRATPSSDTRVLLFGGQNTQGAGNRFMYDPANGSMFGGTTAGTQWDDFTSTFDTFVMGNNHTVISAFDTISCAMVGGSANTLQSYASAILSGTNNSINFTAGTSYDCGILLGNANSLDGEFDGSVIIGCSTCAINSGVASNNNAIMSCNNCNFTTSPNIIDNSGMFASSTCTMNNNNSITACAIISSDTCDFVSSGTIMRQSSIISSFNCDMGGGGANNNFNSIIASQNSTITGRRCAIIGGNNHTITSGQNQAIIGGNGITADPMGFSTLYVPTLRVHGRLTMEAGGVVTPYEVIGRVTLVAGTATVIATITSADQIILSYITVSGVPSHVRITARTDGAPGSFTITSLSAGDTSTIGWIIFNES